jgi:hypothetical protein
VLRFNLTIVVLYSKFILLFEDYVLELWLVSHPFNINLVMMIIGFWINVIF